MKNIIRTKIHKQRRRICENCHFSPSGRTGRGGKSAKIYCRGGK